MVLVCDEDHLPIDHVGVPDNRSQFRVPVASLGALVDIGTANNGQSIINYADFPVDVDLHRVSARFHAGHAWLLPAQ